MTATPSAPPVCRNAPLAAEPMPVSPPGSEPMTDSVAAGMARRERPLYLSTLAVPAGAFTRRHPGVTADAPQARVLRSVLMKPESEDWVATLHARAEELAARQ